MRNRKKDFNKFAKRSSVKERGKARLMAIVNEMNVGTDGAKIKFSTSSAPRSANHTATGIFSESAQGYGFVAVEGLARDVFIPENRIGGAVGGDTVRIRYKTVPGAFGEERTEGSVTEILEYGTEYVIGTVECDVVRFHRRRMNVSFLIPDSPKIKRRIEIRNDGGARDGDKVRAKLLRDELYSYTLTCDVVECYGSSESKEANYLAILAECEIDTEFTGEELEEAQRAASEPISHEGRVVRDEVIFTIDSESAKDLDDAVSLTERDGNYILGVHIADVSHYVKEKTALDRLVTARGTSVYFTDKVVPMLPEALSNGACSLNPCEDKYALSAMVELSRTGDILGVKIEPSVIRSRVKGIYKEINKLLGGTAEEELYEKYRECLPTIEKMHELYLILAKKSRERGAVELSTTEAVILLDEGGSPVSIEARERGTSERMIEQFMLAANEAVATFMKNEGIPCVWRVHEKPDAEKLSHLVEYAHNLGFGPDVISQTKCDSRALARLVEAAEEKGIAEAVSYVCLRSMAKAEYSDINRGHFGLAIENYCHFTSPIRRLSDLITHRILHRVLFDGKPKEKYRSQAKRGAAAATAGEMRAVTAERKIDELYKAVYMKDKVGEVFSAAISSVTSFGFFVMLDNTCEGLVPISTLGGAVFDEKSISLVSGKHTYRIGDKAEVRLESVDVARGKLLFVLEEGSCSE